MGGAAVVGEAVSPTGPGSQGLADGQRVRWGHGTHLDHCTAPRRQPIRSRVHTRLRGLTGSQWGRRCIWNFFDFRTLL